MTRSLKGRTLFITGASRGIGKSIALRAARDGANVVIAAKTDTPHATLPGTIQSAADDVRALGGKALAVKVDLRDAEQIARGVKQAVETFGGIDILVNNASAIQLTNTLATPMNRFDLMFAVNVRGSFACAQACIPHLAKARNPHILNLSPPLNLEAKWFKDHLAYTMSKYGMSMCVVGLAAELADAGIAVNALWPRTVIATAALVMLGGRVDPKNCRTPDIMADAAHAILTRESRRCTGNFFIDEQVLREEGVRSFDRYAVDPGAPLYTDLFLN